jgi:hypothetical protein
MKKTAVFLIALPVTAALFSSPVMTQAAQAQFQPTTSNPISSAIQVLQNPSALWTALLGISPNFLNLNLANNLTGTAFGLTAQALGGFSSTIDRLVASASNFTTLNQTPDFGKLVQALVVAKNITPNQAVLEVRNTINTSVVSDQGKNLKDSLPLVGQLGQQSESIFAANATQTYASTLEAVESVNRQQSAMGSVLDTVMTQNTQVASQIQVSNELALQAASKNLDEERAKTRFDKLSQTVYKDTVEGTTPNVQYGQPNRDEVITASTTPTSAAATRPVAASSIFAAN